MTSVVTATDTHERSVATRDPLVRRSLSLAPAAVAAAAALGISTVLPLAGPLLIALVLGGVAANTRLAESSMMGSQADATKLLLRLGVVLLGLKLPVQEILAIGPQGIAVVVCTVATTYFVTLVVGDRLGLDRGFVTLLAAGFAICGAAAIAAVDDTVRAKQRFVALAVAMVTIFGSAMIAVVPWVGGLVGLTEQQNAIWAGASIHEVAQVVAAASAIGSGALAVATTVKLGRVVLLAPMYAVATRRSDHGRGSGAPIVPWFVLGFGIAVLVRSVGVLPDGGLMVANAATTFLLAAGMFGLGMGIRAKEIWPVPLNAFLLALISTLVAATTSLGLVLALT